MNEQNGVPPMPFYGREFFEAVSMFSDECALKYIRALWFYWSHTHCQGLQNDDEGLRELCKCDTQNWMRTKGLIFDNEHFFCLDNGKWHQKKCRTVFLKTMEMIIKNQQKTAEARRNRWPETVTESGKPISGAVLIFKQNALTRLEQKIESIKNQLPLPENHKLRAKLKELQAERRAIMEELNLKA